MTPDIDLELDRAQFSADPLADDAVAAALGPWSETGIDERLARIGTLNRLIGSWRINADLVGWQAGPGVPVEMAQALQQFVATARLLPDWADPVKITRAEKLFFDQGPLSCLLLFCRSLPECYVLPDLSAVLQSAGQLTQHTDYRVRSTAAMIFPVMMDGGLDTPEGGGIAQTLKVRLIHATIRHLILRGNPSQAHGVVPALPQAAAARSMQQALLTHGWDVAGRGLPCNQMELSYTLLTFNFCFLAAMRKLRLGLPAADEAAYLHLWNVVGHLLGIDARLMVHSMADAQRLFDTMQARGRAQPRSPDPRPQLANALMGAMAAVIPWRLARPMPTLMTRWLCGRVTSRDLGLTGHVSLLSRAVFWTGMATIGGIDRVARLVWPSFSLSRLVVRVLGYHVITQLLMDETRPLALPSELLGRMQQVVGRWGNDPQAPHWMNVMEDRFTTPGAWESAAGR
jgi:hypothetical protein